MDVVSLDHLVHTVAPVEATVEWYGRVLGMEHRADGDRHALHMDRQKINLHQADRTFEPKAADPTPGSADLCFASATPPDEVVRHLDALAVPVEVGPVERQGALGAMTSVSVRDPDANLVEIAWYGRPLPTE